MISHLDLIVDLAGVNEAQEVTLAHIMGTGMADGNVAEEVGVIMFSFAPALAEPLHYQLTLKPYWGACLWRFPCQDGYIPTTQREIAEIPLTPPVHHPDPNTAFAVRIQKAGGIFEQCPILLGFNELGWDNWCVCSTQKHTNKRNKIRGQNEKRNGMTTEPTRTSDKTAAKTPFLLV